MDGRKEGKRGGRVEGGGDELMMMMKFFVVRVLFVE